MRSRARLRPLSLQVFLFLCLGMLAAVPALLLGVAQSESWGAERVAQSDRETELAAELLGRQTGQLMAMHARVVDSLARQVQARGSLEPNDLQPMLSAQRAASGGLSEMRVGNALGIALAVDPPLDAEGKPAVAADSADPDVYRQVASTGRSAVSRAQLGRDTVRPNLRITAPIWDGNGSGRLLGFAEGTLDLGDLQLVAEQLATSHPGLKMVVLDAQGRVLVHPDPELRASMADLSGVHLFQPVTSDQRIRVAEDEAGVAYRAAVSRIDEQGLGWRAIVGRAEASVQASNRAAQADTIGIVAAALALSLVLAGLAAALVARPIMGLTAAADAVARGDFSRPMPRPRWWHPREVHTQLLVVQRMIHRLRLRTEELEQQVASRTAALVASNRVLQEAQQRYQSLFA
ncbi:MAG: cache domain-containing protein, partial [Chloroflexota bacterium]|nr:cache domain-containing protein [Chloroflexota bacterium]